MRRAVITWANAEGYLSLEAQKHQPEPGGCSCGFCAWSAEHVAIMTFREVAPYLRGVPHGTVETLLEAHVWTGGYYCSCGAEMNSSATWAHHFGRLLAAAIR